MEQLTMQFDYAALDSETRIVVQQRTSEIKTLMRRAAQDIIEIGQKLIEVKARLGYGTFGKWLDVEFEWSQDTATNFMRVADRFGNFPKISEIAPSALYLLAAPSTPEAARIEAIERAEAGEAITYSAAREIVSDYRRQCPYCGTSYTVNDTTNGVTQCPTCKNLHAVSAPRANGHAPSVPFVPTAADYADPLGDDEPEAWGEVVAETREIAQPRYAPISDRADYDGDEWKTPAEWIAAARALMGEIDLDPASNDLAQEIVQAGAYFTKDTNGLEQTWRSTDGTPTRVWCNPPYSTTLVQAFTFKALDEYHAGNVAEALVLVNNCTDTGWFFNLAQRFPVMFSRGRVGFWYENPDDKTPTRQGQALFYFGPRVDRFYSCFSHLAYAPIGRPHDAG